MKYLTAKDNRLVQGYGNSVGARASEKVNGKWVIKESYKTWYCMLVRCYSEAYHKRYPAYIGCTVSKEWLSFATFEKWFDASCDDGHQLDIDKLITGNKIMNNNSQSTSFIVCTPDCRPAEVYNLSEYCRVQNLDVNAMIDVAQGKNKTHKGYYCKYAE